MHHLNEVYHTRLKSQVWKLYATRKKKLKFLRFFVQNMTVLREIVRPPVKKNPICMRVPDITGDKKSKYVLGTGMMICQRLRVLRRNDYLLGLK